MYAYVSMGFLCRPCNKLYRIPKDIQTKTHLHLWSIPELLVVFVHGLFVLRFLLILYYYYYKPTEMLLHYIERYLYLVSSLINILLYQNYRFLHDNEEEYDRKSPIHLCLNLLQLKN